MRRRVRQVAVQHDVVVEPGDRPDPADDGLRGVAALLEQVDDEGLDVRPGGLQRRHPVRRAPLEPDPQVEPVRLAGVGVQERPEEPHGEQVRRVERVRGRDSGQAGSVRHVDLQ